MAASDRVLLQATGAGVRLRLRVKPGGHADRLVGPFDGALKVEVRAAPERGRANDAVVRLLARRLGVGRSDVEVVAGLTSQDKVVSIAGASGADVAQRLEALGIATEVQDSFHVAR
jgi:uncharacterized protein YggU (UPF0235/DUF167 family)